MLSTDRNIKIIVLTAGGSDVEVAKGLALGVDAYITKPIMKDELVAKVKELLAKNIKNPWHTQSMISSDHVIRGISLEARVKDVYIILREGGYIQGSVEEKIRRNLMHARKRRGFGWNRWSRAWFYETLGLFNDYGVRHYKA